MRVPLPAASTTIISGGVVIGPLEGPSWRSYSNVSVSLQPWSASGPDLCAGASPRAEQNPYRNGVCLAGPGCSRRRPAGTRVASLTLGARLLRGGLPSVRDKSNTRIIELLVFLMSQTLARNLAAEESKCLTRNTRYSEIGDNQTSGVSSDGPQGLLSHRAPRIDSRGGLRQRPGWGSPRPAAFVADGERYQLIVRVTYSRFFSRLERFGCEASGGVSRAITAGRCDHRS